MARVDRLAVMLFPSAWSVGFGLAIALFTITVAHQVLAAFAPARAMRHRWVAALHASSGGAALAAGLFSAGEARLEDARMVWQTVGLALAAIAGVAYWTHAAGRQGAPDRPRGSLRLVAAAAAVATIGCVVSISVVDDASRAPASRPAREEAGVPALPDQVREG